MPTTVAPTPQPQTGPVWRLAGLGENCDDGCASANLQCADSADALERYSEIDSDAEMASVVQAAGASCSWYSSNWGHAPDVPVIVPGNGLCFLSASDRELSSLVCGARPSASKRRLCLCSSPAEAPSPTPAMTEPSTEAPTTEAPPPETTTVPPVPTPPPVPIPSGIVQVMHRRSGLCVDSPGYATSGSTLQMWACDARVAQKWSYEASTRTLRSHGGTCLYAPAGQLLFVKTCDPVDADQQWTIDMASGRLQNVHGRCMEAAGDENGAGIYMNLCDALNDAQHWDLAEATEEAPVMPSWHLADGGTTCTQSCSSEGLLCDTSAFAERNTDIDSKEEMAAIVKALNVGVECTRFNDRWGSAGDVPVMIPDTGLCFVSAASRSASTFTCDSGVPAHKRRLCLCTTVAPTLIQRRV